MTGLAVGVPVGAVGAVGPNQYMCVVRQICSSYDIVSDLILDGRWTGCCWLLLQRFAFWVLGPTSSHHTSHNIPGAIMTSTSELIIYLEPTILPFDSLFNSHFRTLCTFLVNRQALARFLITLLNMNRISEACIILSRDKLRFFYHGHIHLRHEYSVCHHPSSRFPSNTLQKQMRPTIHFFLLLLLLWYEE
jgi:hypothetical protein